jgi:hypothetical protein
MVTEALTPYQVLHLGTFLPPRGNLQPTLENLWRRLKRAVAFRDFYIIPQKLFYYP